jgi:uncharacterized protein YecE (DUF72 family)
MAFFVGTSGWAYAQWKPDFYPEGLPQTRFLEHYATALNACEINATFYRRQAETTFEKWTRAVGEEFRFTVKAHRMITHARSIAMNDYRAAFIADFVASTESLGRRLGAMFFQIAAHQERKEGALSDLLAAMPEDMPCAFEFLNETWHAPEIVEIVEPRGTICLTDWDGAPPEHLPPGRIAYVRLRAETYSPEQRDGWLHLLERESQGRDVYVFAKHEGTAPTDPAGGVGLAVWLRSAAGRPAAPLP